MYPQYRSAIRKLCIGLVCIPLFIATYAYAAGDAAVSVLNTAGAGTVTITVRNMDGSPSPDGVIRWTGTSAGVGYWRPADQYMEISYSGLPESWGMQTYTDNKSSSPAFTGKGNPAGLVRVDNTSVAIPLAWRITDRPLTPAELANIQERPDGKGMSDYLWYFMKDKNTKDDPLTLGNEAFVNGADYVTIWNQRGIASSEGKKSGSPQKAYLYLAARLITSPVGVQYKTTTLTIEAYHGISPFPFYLYKDGAPAMQMAYEFIGSRMDKYLQGDKKRLIESYADPYPPGPGHLPAYPDNLVGLAFTYDNALAICAYLARPTNDNLYRAKLLCNSLIWAQQHDTAGGGRLRDAYDATREFTGATPPLANNFFNGSTTGNIAWVINALMQYYKNSGDSDTAFLNDVLSAAQQAGDFIHTNFYHSSQAGYYYGFESGGALNRSKSTEHNIAVYTAFSHLYDITGDNKWLLRAINAKNFVENIAWNSADKRYICGLDSGGTPNTGVLVADTNLLAVLGMANLARNKDAIAYTVTKFYKRVELLGGSDQAYLQGVDFGYVNGVPSEPDGIWFEGTAQLAQAYKVAGFYGYTDESAKYLESIKLAQYDALHADYKSIVAASKDDLTTGLGWSYYASPHIAPTAWFVSCRMNYNMLWGTPLNTAVPSPGDNRSFGPVDPALLIDKADYLENHYYPSGWLNYKEGVVAVDERCSDSPYSGDTCFKISWNGKAGAEYKWGGIIWQEPENEWVGGAGKGYDLRYDSSIYGGILTFWARTDSFSYVAGKNLKIKVYFGYENDSCGEIPPAWRTPALTTEWHQYSIFIVDKDMSHVSNGFTIIFNDDNTPRSDDKCNIYLDDIRFEIYERV